MSDLKYSTIERGALVKAYDFEPHPDRAEMFLVGEVVAHDTTHPAGHFLIVLITEEGDAHRTEHGHSRVGQTARVPMEVGFEASWEVARVQVLQTAAQYDTTAAENMKRDAAYVG